VYFDKIYNDQYKIFGHRTNGKGLFNSDALMNAVKSPSNYEDNYRFARQINVINDWWLNHNYNI